jgi:UDPglucose 6-dehydrogenase
LQDHGAIVHAYDPQGMEAARRLLEGVTFSSGVYDAAEAADALVIVTEWDAFRALDFGRLKAVMKSSNLIDLRNIYRRDEVLRHGFSYWSIGRPSEDIRTTS